MSGMSSSSEVLLSSAGWLGGFCGVCSVLGGVGSFLDINWVVV